MRPQDRIRDAGRPFSAFLPTGAPYDPERMSEYAPSLPARPSPRSARVWQILRPRLAFALLSLLVVWAYLPARTRYFASDQLLYLAELNGDRSWAAGFRLLDYAVERRYNKGDEVSYRPLLFTWMAARNALSGRDVRTWNAAGLAAHLFAAWALFETLWRLRRSAFAHALALWFALLAANLELVTWNHLDAYMLGFGGLLIAFMAAREAVRDGSRCAWTLYALSMFAAMLIHEIAVPAALLAVPFAGLSLRGRPPREKIRALVPLLAPLVLYAALYAGHAARCERLLWTGGTDAGPALGTLPLRMVQAAGLWTSRILIPAAVDFTPRLLDRSLWRTPDDPAALAGIALQIALWAGVAWTLRKAASRSRLRAEWRFVAWIGVLLATYAAVLAMGRDYILSVPYYPYFFALFGIVGVYATLDLGRPTRNARIAALALLLALGALNGWKVRQTSQAIDRLHEPITRYFDSIERQIRARRDDPGFTFGIRNAPVDCDIPIHVSIGYPDRNLRKSIPLTQVVYGPRCTPFLPAAWVTPE